MEKIKNKMFFYIMNNYFKYVNIFFPKKKEIIAYKMNIDDANYILKKHWKYLEEKKYKSKKNIILNLDIDDLHKINL